MKKYGNISFNRRVVAFVCLLVVAVSVLMPLSAVFADSSSGSASRTFYSFMGKQNFSASELYFTNVSYNQSDGGGMNLILVCSSDVIVTQYDYGDNSHLYNYTFTFESGGSSYVGYCFTSTGNFADYKAGKAYYSVYENGSLALPNYDLTCDKGQDYKSKLEEIFPKIKSGEFKPNCNVSYKPTDKAYSEIGALDNVQMETYITNKKELINADENADLSKIKQDKVIVYSSTSTTGIDLSKGGYKVQLYGSYAWQDKSGHIKSEDKGHKTFIKDWKAENNIKGLNRSNYTWIDWKSANDKVESDKTDNAHKPNVFEKMTTYGNYQFEPIWYLRIVSKDNKYGAWVKLFNSSSKKGKYTSETVDDNDKSVSDSDGGYSKPKDTSEITGIGDTPEDAKNNVQKTEEKQDNKDIQDASGGNNSTFDKLEEFTKGIGDVPKIIADIFSFLPSWCLEVVAIGFALLMILVVVKFIRG